MSCFGFHCQIQQGVILQTRYVVMLVIIQRHQSDTRLHNSVQVGECVVRLQAAEAVHRLNQNDGASRDEAFADGG
ncbi:hypothetical protein D3C73_1395750 [compost metagenome]